MVERAAIQHEDVLSQCGQLQVRQDAWWVVFHIVYCCLFVPIDYYRETDMK